MSTIDKESEQSIKVNYKRIQSELSNKRNVENTVKNLFNHELKEEFQNLLISSKDNFINSVKQNVFLALISKYTNNFFDNKHFVSILSKYYVKINNKYDTYYSSLSAKLKEIQKEKTKKNKNSNLVKYYFSLHRKHCSYTSNYALHLCNSKKGLNDIGKFIKISNDLYNDQIDYLICENCHKVYAPECFSCYCQYCKEVYLSSKLAKNENNYLLPATLKNNHCETIINDYLYCSLCKNILYLNININKLQCINEKCTNNNITKNNEWKCKTCSQYFTSDFKVYNPLEIKLLSEAINYSLCIKIKAKPNKLPCCKNTDLNKMDFFHSKKCNGLIYLGKYNKKIFIVCEKCKAINFNEKYIWTCPKCKCRFREIKEKENNNNNYYIKNIDNTIKECNDKFNNFEMKKNFENKNENNYKDYAFEKRKRIFSQEYDYDSNSFSMNKKNSINDENFDINKAKNDLNDFNNKNNFNINENYNCNNSSICKKDKMSRNERAFLNTQNFSNNIIFTKIFSSKVFSSIDTEEKKQNKKRAISDITSNDFYSERNEHKKNFKKLKYFRNLPQINTNNKKSQDNISSSLLMEKTQRKNNFPHTGNDKNKHKNSKKINNINFLENKLTNLKKRSNFTPSHIKLNKKLLKNEKNDNIVKNISQFCINNLKMGNNQNNNHSPFLLRRILNISLNNSAYDECKKKENKDSKNNKNNKCKKKPCQIKNYIKFRLKSSDTIEKDYKVKNNSNNYINSIPNFNKRKSIIFLENNKNKSDMNIGKKDKINNLISKLESKNKKGILAYKNVKSKSEDKINEKINFNSSKCNIKHRYKGKVKKLKEEISLKPSDIIEPTMVDPSIDIPISNEEIRKDEKLYNDIQRRIKKVLSRGKLPQFILENYTIISQLGEGSFGLIFKVYNNETKINYAMKKIIANNIHSLEVYQREFEIVHENSHPNILDIHGVCMRCLDTTTYVLYVLMDIAEKDWEAEINERAKIKKYYLEKELISILKQIVSALCFLQKEKNVAHRDIKPENILVFKNNIYKIADFGEAKKSNINKFRTLRGTEFYMSPILYKNLKIKNDYVKHNPYKSDVFSLGYCLVCATALDFDIIDNIRGKNESEIREVFNKAFPSIYSNKFVELIFKMIEQDERKRVDFIHLKQILDKEF
jgi:hypothetical protein